MFRTPRFLEKADYIQFNLDTPLGTVPGNNQHQLQSSQKFFVKDRDNISDWYTALFISHLRLSQTALVALMTRGRPNQQYFYSDKSMAVKSAGKTVYETDNLHKVIFIRKLLGYFDHYSRSVAKSQFW